MSITSGSSGPFVAPPGPAPALARQGATPGNGFTKQNGTPNILTIAAPNDGMTHLLLWSLRTVVTAIETGGIITMTRTVGGTQVSTNVDAGGGAVGGSSASGQSFSIDPGTVVTFTQGSALTAGASVVFIAAQII